MRNPFKNYSIREKKSEVRMDLGSCTRNRCRVKVKSEKINPPSGEFSFLTQKIENHRICLFFSASAANIKLTPTNLCYVQLRVDTPFNISQFSLEKQDKYLFSTSNYNECSRSESKLPRQGWVGQDVEGWCHHGRNQC